MKGDMEKPNIEIIRHSLSHLLAAVVLQMFPDAKLGIGPAIENGFYYDFDLSESLTPDDVKKIHQELIKMIVNDYKFVKRTVKKAEAIKYLKSMNQSYKVELAEEIKDEEIIFYDLVDEKTGKVVFIDMCAGPHIESTKTIGEVGLAFNRIAGAYWRGSEKNKMLQRIYFYSFSSIKEMSDFRKMLEEAEKRDHKKLGREMDLFSFHPEAPGQAFWHPKGMSLWNNLEVFGKEMRKKYGFIEIKTPLLAKNSLWITSGHWDHYKESMFSFDLDGEIYCLKPMDCPFNIKIYQTKTRSYKDLPIRYTEIGRVYRNEKSGELNGLLRVQEITQDDSHIFLKEDQVKTEVVNLLNMTKEYYAKLGLKPEFFLSTRPEDFIGEVETWNKAEADLKDALEDQKIVYKIKEKDGAFYGPKIDVDIKDALGRSWQVATIQLDFQLPGRFDCEYTDEKGELKIPVMIHAAVFGSFERMIGILTEHFGGAFPSWLAPLQSIILPISDKHNDYAGKILNELIKGGIRAEIDSRQESIAKKIREAEMQKIPFMIIVGDKEIEAGKIAIRKYGEGDKGQIETKALIEEING